MSVNCQPYPREVRSIAYKLFLLVLGLLGTLRIDSHIVPSSIIFCHHIYVGILLYRITHQLVDPKHKFAAEAASSDCRLLRASRSFEWRAVIGSAFVRASVDDGSGELGSERHV